jgi:hypothetical protein
MLIVGLVPLIAGLDISEIARAATVAASIPGVFIFWVVTRIPSKFPEAYSRSMIKPGPVVMWGLFIFAEAMTVLGIFILAEGLPPHVLGALSASVVVAFAYYPIRKRIVAQRGIDLDARTNDPSIFDA